MNNEYQFQLKEKKQEAINALEIYKRLTKEIYMNCLCPTEDLIDREEYLEDSTYYWKECEVCGRKYEESRTLAYFDKNSTRYGQ